MHVLPRVAELHHRFENELVVIGVHAGKFPAERSTDRIRAACARLGVAHPVVNDRQFRVWHSYAVQAWPTVVLVSPDGRVVGSHAGEFRTGDLASAIENVIDEHPRAGTLDETPRDFGADPNALAPPTGPLYFPGRVTVDGERLFVADTGHHRVLELRLVDGTRAEIVRAFGSGRAAFADGPADVASFREPQGLAIDGGRLYVADRANHALRAVDLGTGAVSTLAGTGELADTGIHPGPGTATSLRSPWDVAVSGGGLYVAMAGSHQLWRLDLATGQIAPFAGTGGEAIGDGPAGRALLAQPMGIAAAGDTLAFCDAESSAVRTVDARPDADVRTLVGTGLFDFGDVDGVGDDARLQHVEALAWLGDRVVVSDTLNDKLKWVDPATRACTTMPSDAGSGDALDHPGGIAIAGNTLLVADTDAHRIATVDPATGAVATLEIV